MLLLSVQSLARKKVQWTGIIVYVKQDPERKVRVCFT